MPPRPFESVPCWYVEVFPYTVNDAGRVEVRQAYLCPRDFIVMAPRRIDPEDWLEFPGGSLREALRSHERYAEQEGDPRFVLSLYVPVSIDVRHGWDNSGSGPAREFEYVTLAALVVGERSREDGKRLALEAMVPYINAMLGTGPALSQILQPAHARAQARERARIAKLPRIEIPAVNTEPAPRD